MTADLLKGFYLGDLLIEPARGRVTGPLGSGHLPPKAIEVLLCLCAHPGEVVARDALLEDVWGAGAGSPEALSHAVSEIRHVLGDHRSDPEFIQTLPKRGYRLLVQPVAASGDTATIVLGARNSISPHELGLFENLKQRGVLETGIAYLILGWLLIQVADIVFDQLLLPRWVGTFVTVLVIAGFPIAIILSWFLEFRHGRAILHDLTPKDARKRRFGRTYVSVIGALGIAALLVFIYDKSIGLPEEAVPEQTVVDESLVLPPVLDNSIAVLPFLNLDGSEETQIFANGLVDDVITRLSRVPRLLVSSRGDAFTLEPNSASELVRQRLRVARYLEGSVQTDGDMLRIIVQMIDSETGFHILSRSFDRPRSDFFEIRDEITALTVANVRVALPQDKQLLSLRPDDTPTLDAYLLYRRGIEATRSALSMDSINESLSWFEQALAVDPEYAAAHAGKCVAYVSGFDEIHVTSMIDKAQGSCSKALQLNPNLDIVHTALGNLYLSIGQFEDAEQSFRRALEIDPASSESYMGLGEVYTGLNRPEDAEYNFRQAVGLRPGDWAPYNNLGNFLYYQGRYGEAAEQYQYAIALDRSNSNAYSNLGAVHMLAGDFEAALIAFQRSIEINPKATAYSNLGTMHYYLGQYDESIENHRTAVSLEPDDHVSRSNLGDALWNSGDRERAREVFQDALLLAEDAFDVNPNHPFTIMILAWIHAMLGDENEARALMDRARSLAPDDPFTHYYDGLVSARIGDMGGAIAALKVAVDSGYPIALLAAEPHLAPLHDFTEFLEIIGAD